jgi:hypothetical protein
VQNLDERLCQSSLPSPAAATPQAGVDPVEHDSWNGGVISPMSGQEGDTAAIFARKWRAGLSDAVALVDQFFKETGASMATVEAAAFVRALPSISQIDRLIAEHEKRRDEVLWLIDQYQTVAAERAAIKFESKSNSPSDGGSGG